MDRALAALILAGCAPEVWLADEIVSAVPSDGAFGDPALAVNGVRGGGQTAGSLDVFSMGPADALVLAFADPVPDGDGPDIAVFENPFDVNGGGRFFDPVVVEVSEDCESFVPFPAAHEGDWDADASTWSGFAGLTPVLFHEEDNPVDPLSELAGGDRFDLAEIGVAEIRCVRMTSAVAFGFPADPASNGPDIDGVYGRASD